MSVPAEALARDAPVAGRVQRECACAHKGETCAECAAEEQSRVQPKLRLGTPGDRWEREADWIAEQVVADRPTPISGPLPVTPLVQMQEDEDEERRPPEEEDEEELQAKAAAGPAPAPAVARAAAAVAGGGRPLSRSERAWIEPRLSRDLSPVRVHDDAAAGAAARGIDARAYTLRNHIAFAPGAYDAGSTEGRRLMAHEVVHTLQQRGRRPGVVRRQPARCAALMRRPTPSDMATGNLVEREIVGHYEARYGKNQKRTLPDASFGPYRLGTRRFQPKEEFSVDGESRLGTGRPDLALRSRGGEVMLLAEIKPGNLSQFLNGKSQLLNYIDKGNSEDNLPVRQALGIRVFSPMFQVGSRYATPSFVSFAGRRFRVMWCGPGVIVYKEIKKKQKKKKDKKAPKKDSKPAKKSSKSTPKSVPKKTGAPGAKPGPKPTAGAFNFGIGLSIFSAHAGAGNVGIGVTILSEGGSLGTISAGIAYNTQGVAVGTVGAGMAKDSQVAAALAAGLGTIEESTVAALATAGTGEVAGASGGAVAEAGTGTVSGSPEGEVGAAAEVAGEDDLEFGKSRAGAGAGSGDTAAVEAAVRAAAETDRAVQGTTEAQRRFLEAIIAGTEGGVYVLPVPEWVARMLAATEGASEEELAYLATLTWRPSRSSGAELRRAVRRALARRGTPPTAAGGPADPVEKRPAAAKKAGGAGGGKPVPGAGEKQAADAGEKKAGTDEKKEETGEKAAQPSAEERQERSEYLENLRDRARAFDLASRPEGAVVYDNAKQAPTPGQRVKATLYFPMTVESGVVVAACDVVGVRSGSGKDLNFEALEAGPVVTSEGEVFENSAPLIGRPISISDPTPEAEP